MDKLMKEFMDEATTRQTQVGRPLKEGFDTDESLVAELVQWTENDGQVYEQRATPVMKNMMRKLVKGKYDHQLAVKAWMYVVEDGARSYSKEFGEGRKGEWATFFPKNIRLAAAKEMADSFLDEVKAGGYSPEDFDVKGEVQLPGAKQEGKKAGKRKISKRISEAKRRRMKENASRSDVDSYLETALWSSTGDDDEPLDKNFSIGDFSAEARALAEKECSEFYAKAESLLTDNDPDHWPHDFWLTRNGHGTGFWDGDYENGDELTEIAEQFYESDIYVGDNGEVELSSPSRKTERKHR